MNGFDLREVFVQRGDEAVGEHGYPVIAALAVVDKDAMVFKVNIFHAQPQAFHESKPAAVHDLNHEFVWACHVGDDGPGFIPGKHNGNPFPLFGPDEINGSFIQFDFQEIAIEEDDGTEGLVLSGCGGFALDHEVGDELVDFGDAHFARVAFVMKEDVFANPMSVCLFCSRGVLLDANLVAVLVEQFFPLWG